MLILLLSSVLSFLLLFAALLVLLRRAGARAQPAGRPASTRSAARLPSEPFASAGNPRLPAKRPDWRFLVRGRKHPRFTSLRRAMPEPAPNANLNPQNDPVTPVLTSDGKPRSDWAYFNADLGDLQDPSESFSLARRA